MRCRGARLAAMCALLFALATAHATRTRARGSRPHPRVPHKTNATKPLDSLTSDLTVDDLPPLKQTDKRLLVAVSVGETKRPRTLTRLLDSFVNVCEAGYEVHIVLVAHHEWHVNDAEIYSKSRFLCMRLRRDLPIVVRYHKHVGQPLDTVLSSVHRGVFVELKDRYDLFLSQEDDMLVTLRHVLYFDKWATRFAATDLYPGFAVAEVPVPAFSVPALYNKAPIVWNTHTNRRRVFLFTHNGTLMLAHAKAWAPLYFLTRDMLANVSCSQDWLQDASKPWIEFNAHFQHLWLARQKRIVVPVEDVDDSFVLHMPNNYVSYEIERNANATHHDYGVELDEFKATVAQCCGHGNSASSWDVAGMHYHVKTDEAVCAHNSVDASTLSPCSACLSHGLAVDMDMTFPQPMPALSGGHESAPVVHFCCMDVDSMPRQEIAGLRQR